MKRYEIHGSDFYKMGEFMDKLKKEYIEFNPYRINGYFIDVKSSDVEKYEEIAKDMVFIIKQVQID